MALLKKFEVRTEFNQVLDITDKVMETVDASGVEEGTCIVYNPHSTAALATYSPWDPDGLDDLRDEIVRLVPTRIDFHHQHDTPQDAAGHFKSALLGVSMPLIVHEGKLLLGGSQHVYFLEFDGPRDRHYFVKVFSD